jgi:periplasmic protein TonB
MQFKLNLKYLLIVLSFLLFYGNNATYCLDQMSAPGDDEYAIVVDKAPAPVGGFESIIKKISYPSMAIRTQTEGKVYLLIFTNTSGDVDDVKVVKGIGAGCDEESVRVIKKTKFTPGIVNGAAVKTKFTLAISFKIPG